MHFNPSAPVQAFLRPKNQFSLFFVAYFVAKLLHLGSHAASLPIVLYLLYFPTFVLPDILLLVGSKVLVYTQHGGQTSAIRKAIGGLLSVFTAGCAAAEISFFIETGGEIQWMAASRVLGGGGGLGLLLSGLPSMGAAFAILYTIAWIITPRFYDVVDGVLERISSSFRWIYRSTKRAPDVKEDRVPLIILGDDQDSPPLVLERPIGRVPSTRTALAVCFTTLAAIIVVIVLQSVRPTSPPYAHMSGSLPMTLIEAAWFQPINSEFCLPHPVEAALFPYERFNAFYNQTTPPDWVPQSDVCSRTNGRRPPPWQEHPGDEKSPHKGVLLELGDSVKVARDMFHLDYSPHGPPSDVLPLVDFPHGPPGLSHDTSPSEYTGHGHQRGYTPVCDPLKLSNLKASVLPSLTASMRNTKPKIKNILLLTLESTRKDMFPLKKNSHTYKTILATYKSPNATEELDAKLANLTDTAAFLSGESNGFGLPQKNVLEQSWRGAFKHGMGAINIDGAITQATYTFKSLVSSHCGVEPLPVDFTEEFKGRIYQACLPQIVQKLSPGASETKPDQKHDRLRSKDHKEDYRSLDWSSALVQSVIDQFDNQDLLDEQMGFKHVITEATISDEKSKYFPPKQPWINYFGYAETEAFGYLRDLFVDGQQQGKRVFVSHITSTTHHPFATPKDWVGRTTYMEKQHWRTHDPFEDYLNAIKYQDEWIADIFQMLHDTGALRETLVVMAGDHGLAFKSPDKSHSPVNNGHISNFAIPLLFVHPDLPRIQINASTTPLSIIPTVLDLLQETDSLSPEAAKIASELLPSYQGNSLIRNLDFNIRKTDGTVAEAFFQPFHFSIINPGGSLLAISDASTTFRLVLPLCSTIPLRFTDTAIDPNEADPIVAWTMDKLVAMIQVRHGSGAKDWAQLAEELGRWWFWNQREKWGYWGVARSTSRGGGDSGGKGQIKHKHWWET